MFPSDFLGLGKDMGDAGLPVQADAVISGIAVTYQRAVKVISEDAFGHLGRPMPVDVKEGEVWIACEPYIMADAVTAPGGFIGMDHVGGPDLVTQILIDRYSPCCRFAIEPQAEAGTNVRPNNSRNNSVVFR